MYMGTGTTLRRKSLGTRLGLWIDRTTRHERERTNMIHDNHGGRERTMVCTKVKGHTPNLFSWNFLPCENLAQETSSSPNQTSLIPWQHKCIAEEH